MLRSTSGCGWRRPVVDKYRGCLDIVARILHLNSAWLDRISIHNVRSEHFSNERTWSPGAIIVAVNLARKGRAAVLVVLCVSLGHLACGVWKVGETSEPAN